MFLTHELGNFIPRGGAGGVFNKVLYGEALPRGQTPYPFIYHFCQKRYLFRVPSIQSLLTNGTPFTYLVYKVKICL